MTKRVLVAGGTGYLGGFVLEAFKRQGHHVRALARRPARLRHLEGTIDEIVSAEITQPRSLAGICDDIDVVFSSVGITKQRSALTFEDVDYQGNLNLLEEAERAGVSMFIYVSVFNGPKLRSLAIVDAHERFVDVLRRSGLEHRVIRPTGYFSDLGEFFEMAKRGRVHLFGPGDNRINPIHGADLAEFCVESMSQPETELDVGGPHVHTYQEIARLAHKALGNRGRAAKVSSLPIWLTKTAVGATKFFSGHTGGMLEFITTMCTSEVVAPRKYGAHSLEHHYEELARSAR